MAVSFSSISGMVYPAGQSAFQASLEESILHGSQLLKHLWKSLTCMAVSFSGISGRVYPAWQSAFQASLEESILHGSGLIKHLWGLSCMAVSFSSISGRGYLTWQSAFQASLEGPILHASELFKHRKCPPAGFGFPESTQSRYPARCPWPYLSRDCKAGEDIVWWPAICPIMLLVLSFLLREGWSALLSLQELRPECMEVDS